MNFTYILNDFLNPLFNFPPREGRAFKNSPAGYFSDGARLQGWPSPMGEGWDGDLISIREDLFNIKRH